MGRGGSKKFKLILTPPYGASLKSCLISTSPPLQDKENSHGAKLGEAGQARRDKIAIPRQ